MKVTDFTSLDIEQVIFIHEQIVSAAGGVQGIRDFTLLHSALERCKATYAGEDLYPTLFDKAAALLHSLVMNHAFLDGNKRTAYAITVRFLNHNGFVVTSDQTEVVRFCIAVDNDGLKGKDIVSWLEKYCQVQPGT